VSESTEKIQFGIPLLAVAFLLSLLINVAFVILVLIAPRKEVIPLQPGASVQARVLDEKELSDLTARVLKKQKSVPRSVVESEVAPVVKNPKDMAKYLGERTQRVEKETRSKRFGSVTGGKKSEKKDLQATTKSLQELGVSSGVGFLVLSQQKVEASDGGGDAKLTQGSHDPLDNDVAIGTRTLLNHDEYVYAGFYNRLKSEVAGRWEPYIRRIITGRGKRIREGLYKTETRFTVNAEGAVSEVFVEKSSGDELFDEAAKTALFELLRIENPPSGLRDQDGLYRIELGFIVNLEKAGVNMQYEPDPRLLQRRNGL
jgi:TonB family protein